MAVGGGMVAAVGYAMVINMMATREGLAVLLCSFVFAINQLTLIALGVVVLPLLFSTLVLRPC